MNNLNQNDGFVNGEDDRVLVAKANPIIKFICRLNIDAGTKVGTGFYVKHNSKVFLLTAAHNLYKAKKIEIFEGNGNGNATVLPKNICVSSNYVPTPDGEDDMPSANDYGIIFHDGHQADSFQLTIPSDNEILNNPIAITGYPLELGPENKEHKNEGSLPYEATGTALKVESNLISYYVDTSPGQSGSPVWSKIGNQNVVFGIHLNSIDVAEDAQGNKALNNAVKINREMLNEIEKWLAR
jgi:glutamyl endopeptidase